VESFLTDAVTSLERKSRLQHSEMTGGRYSIILVAPTRGGEGATKAIKTLVLPDSNPAQDSRLYQQDNSCTSLQRQRNLGL
jgi:hypothetical protein